MYGLCGSREVDGWDGVWLVNILVAFHLCGLDQESIAGVPPPEGPFSLCWSVSHVFVGFLGSMLEILLEIGPAGAPSTMGPI